MRKFSLTYSGSVFSEAIVNAVWSKGVVVPGYNPAEYRMDACGAYIQRSNYGVTSSRFGWEVDHIKPIAKGGIDDLSNLQPLQWENNRGKSDNWPNWSCSIKAA